MSYIVHINGWPGTGKTTIGRLLAQALGARFLSHHVFVDAGKAVAPHNTDAFTETADSVRTVILSGVESSPDERPIVITDVLFAGNPQNIKLSDQVKGVADRLHWPCYGITLDCDLVENARRLAAPDRVDAGKLTDAAILGSLRASEGLLRRRDPLNLDLDVSTLSAAEAAERVGEWVRVHA